MKEINGDSWTLDIFNSHYATYLFDQHVNVHFQKVLKQKKGQKFKYHIAKLNSLKKEANRKIIIPPILDSRQKRQNV